MLEHVATFFSDVSEGNEAAIVLLASGYFGLMGLIGAIYGLWIRSWPMTEGNLVQSGLESMGPSMRADEQHFQAGVRYTYEVDGVEYEGSRLSPTYIMASANLRFLLKLQMRGIKKLGGDRVAVIYNPSNHTKSFLIKPGPATFLLPAMCILVSILLALY